MTLQSFGDYLKYMQGKERRSFSESTWNGCFRMTLQCFGHYLEYIRGELRKCAGRIGGANVMACACRHTVARL